MLLLALALVAATGGMRMGGVEAEEPLDISIQQIDDSGYPNVRLVISVTDSSGRPVTDLTDQDFRVTSAGTPLSVRDVGPVLNEDAGIGLVLAIDVSGSMQGVPLERAKEVSWRLVQQLSPSDGVAVLGFSDQVSVVLRFTADKGAVEEAIRTLVAGGNTALYAAVGEAADLAQRSDLPRVAVLLLSDGRDIASQGQSDRETSLEAARLSGVPFFVVGLGSDIDEDYLRQVAAASEAPFYLAPSPESLGELFDAISTMLRTQYVITFDGRSVPLSDQPSVTVMVERGEQAGQAQRNLPEGFLRPRATLAGIPEGPIDRAISVQASITAPRQVASVTFVFDGQEVHSAEQAPFELPLDPIDYTPGKHELKAVVTDVAGDVGEAEVTIEVAAVPPRVNILNAEQGAVVRGSLTLELDVRSQTPLAELRVLVDGQRVRADGEGRFRLDTETLGEGPRRLEVVAVDEAGSRGEAAVTLEFRPAAAGGGGMPWPAVVVPLAAVVAVAAALWYRRRRRRGQEPRPEGVLRPLPGPAPAPVPVEAAAGPEEPAPHPPRLRGVLTLANGADGPRRFVVAAEPVTIGSDLGCTIVLPDASGRVAPRAVRVWLREDKFMLHRLPRRANPMSGERGPRWAVLESGDEISVGPYRFSFEIADTTTSATL